jgi:phage terminase large subunit GpA-like protein
MDLICDERYNSMTLCWGSQVLGKTEVLNTVLGWNIECGPGGGMMCVQPTLAMATSWAKLKLAPLLKDLEKETKEKSFSQKGATAESTVQLKIWENGFLVTGGANSPAALASFTCRITAFDEVDRYPPTVATRGNIEGDPLTVAERRSETFPDSFSIHTSTPTTAGMSRIDAEMSETDYRKWHIKCKKCKWDRWVIMFNDIRWEADRPETAWLECPRCHGRHTDKARVEMVCRGRWIVTNPGVKNKPGFWANAFITLLRCKRKYKNRLHQWAAEFLEAKRKGIDVLRAFVNQVMTETFEEPAERPTAPEILFNRREHFFEGTDPKLPDGVLVLTVGADKQIDRIEAELVGWGAGEESWSLDYRVFPGDFENKKFRDTINEWLLEKYYLPNGQFLDVAAAAFDSGDRPESVYKFVRECAPRAVWAVKGHGSMDLPWMNRSRTQSRLYNLNVDVAKATIMSRLAVSEPGPGYHHFPWNRDLEWYRQLTSERLVSYTRLGQTFKRFELRGGARNEALDARVYAYAALCSLGRVAWDKIKTRLGTEPFEPIAAENKEPPDPILNRGVQHTKPRNVATRQRPRATWGGWR